MRAHIPIVTLVLLLMPVVVPGLTAATANAEVITVCWDGSGDYLTIQEGINAASDGDEVVVCDGVYTGAGNKNLDFHGKAITVRSTNGPDNCIIDCENDGRGFLFHNEETDASVVDGFTITNGNASYGAAICCPYSSPAITNCTIAGNSADHDGGGVWCRESSPTISNCSIAENWATMDGGGVYCVQSSPRITNCTIMANTAYNLGGGVLCVDSSPMISDCTITGNSVNGDGGGVSCIGGSPTITDCTIIGNTADTSGGGVCCFGGDPTISNCTITGNSAGLDGGGVCCRQASPRRQTLNRSRRGFMGSV